MSNTLTIMVTEFKTVARISNEPVTTFGYTAFDQYDQDYNMEYPTLESFYKSFPTEQALIDLVLSDCDMYNDFYADDGNIEVIGFDNPFIQD